MLLLCAKAAASSRPRTQLWAACCTLAAPRIPAPLPMCPCPQACPQHQLVVGPIHAATRCCCFTRTPTVHNFSVYHCTVCAGAPCPFPEAAVALAFTCCFRHASLAVINE